MKPTLPDELAKLKDAHELAAISWWPPAIGWWLLAGAVLLLLIMLVVYLYPRWQLRNYRRFFRLQLQRLQATPDATQMQQLNLLIKKMALLAFPRTEVASLTGSAWTKFLREQGPKNRTLTALQTALGEQQFQMMKTHDHQTHDTEIYTPELWRDAEAWLDHALKTQRQSILQFRKKNRMLTPLPQTHPSPLHTHQSQETAC